MPAARAAPEVARRLTEEGLVLDLVIRPELPWFDGHFPGEPVLAGAVQILWAITAARELLGVDEGPAAILQLKFKSPIRPGERVELAVTRTAGGVNFRYRSDAGDHSSGCLSFSGD